MMTVHNFSYGLVTPIVAYLMSCLGCFLGLRCTTRARAFEGAARARWLLLAGLSIGVTGIWVMHFIAMLGFTTPGQPIGYNVPVTILSMLIAVIVVSGGLLIVGFSANGVRPLLLGGVVIGIGVASMHYMGMAAVLVPGGSEHYSIVLVALSLVIAIVAGTAALWAALRLQGLRATFTASLIMGVAVSGMHYTGMAALRMNMAGAASAAAPGGASAEAFLLPLIIGISVLTFVLAAIILLSPTEDEIREDAILMERIARLSGETAGPPRP
jgi:NO-binding membrane sensor protein with MHYT domain